MRILSRKDIEAISERVIMAYQMMPENKGKVMNKVDPELLVHGLLGLTIDYKHLSLDDSILGLTAFDETDIQIYDDAEDSYYLDSQTVLIERDLLLKEECQGRRNFTIMHEGSHQIYKMLYPREYGVAYRTAPIHYYRLQSIRSRKITDWAEWQANSLASYLLLPRECVERSMFMFGFGEKIHMLNRVYAQKSYERFVDMSIFLGVSKTALAIRLKQLGLLEHDYLDDPYALLDVRKEDTHAED